MSTTPMEDAESQKNVEAPVMTSVAAANSVDYKGRPIDHARTGRYKAASFLLGTHQVWIYPAHGERCFWRNHRVCAFWWDVFIFKVFSLVCYQSYYSFAGELDIFNRPCQNWRVLSEFKGEVGRCMPGWPHLFKEFIFERTYTMCFQVSGSHIGLNQLEQETTPRFDGRYMETRLACSCWVVRKF